MDEICMREESKYSEDFHYTFAGVLLSRSEWSSTGLTSSVIILFQKAMIKDLASEAQKFDAKRVPLGPEDNAQREWFIISLILLLDVG